MRFCRRGNTLAGACLALGATILACSPDLHENVGPRVPVPNVEGRVLRAGRPAGGVDIELEDVQTGAVGAETSTGADGRYAFTEVAAGVWQVGAESDDPEDYEQVTCEFRFDSPDTNAILPDLDVSMNGLERIAPEDSLVGAPPSPFSPLTFEWHPGEQSDSGARYRIRLYSASGEGIWFSEKAADTRVDWNGIVNEGDGAGRRVQPGEYRWRLRVYGEDGIEYSTDYRHLVFENAAWR